MMLTKSLASTASVVAAFVLGGLVLFQLALALGVPWGNASYGGAEATLPTHLRATSLGAVVFWSLVILVVLRRGGHQVWSPLPVAWLPVATWLLVGLMVVACVVNALTSSAIERAIWLPVSVALLATLITVQVTVEHELVRVEGDAGEGEGDRLPDVEDRTGPAAARP